MNRKRSAISLSCGLTVPPTTVAAVHTPNTPEILNTIFSITTRTDQQLTHQEQSSNMHPLALIRHPYSNFSDSYTASSQSFPVSLLASRATTTYQTNANEQVHDFHSQFVKEGLKLKVKRNLKLDPDDALHQLLSQNIKKETEVSTLSQLFHSHQKRTSDVIRTI